MPGPSSTANPRLLRRLALRRLWIALAIGVAALAALAGASSGAQVLADESATLERSVKAAFVFKFAGFVTWPPGAFGQVDTPIQVAVMGEDAIVQDIAQAGANRTVEGRRVQARRVDPGEPLDGVHILFLRDAAYRRLRDSLRELKPDAMLIVTESDDAIGRGSVINFVLDEGRVRFDISLGAAEQRGLKLSSRLITVARNVGGRQR